MRRAARFTLFLLLVAAGVTAQVTEELSVSYVMIPFTVLGSRGVPITNLDAKEVSLMIDGRPVPSDMFEKSMNAPVSWTLLVDGSGSMGLAGKLEAARAAVTTLISRRKTGDDFSLYVFAEGQAREIVPFTTDPAPILVAMDKLEPYGKTAFFDAVADIPERSQLGTNPTRAIVLLSDGIDNNSQLTRPQIARLLEGVAVPIYAVGLREPGEFTKETKTSESSSDLALLGDLATLTGGKLYVGNRPAQLGKALDGIEQELRAQYLIGFSPTGKGAVKYRRITLKLAGRVQSVRVRAGYRGTEPPVMSAAASRKKPQQRKEGK
ncbi:MAG TPA: VWA domain-containing protein [Thermoanaerobaculia bacterium]|jgi:Ca-activated chloride channel family protein